MKLKFKTQAHQTLAVQAVVDCFKGQPRGGASTGSGGLFPEAAFSNAEIELPDSVLLDNIREVQRARNLQLSRELVRTGSARVNLDIEMETGTGKTYCYIRTIFELNRQYGWSRFIIVVPSVAIREGVAKSLRVTAGHFLETYQKKVRFFLYDSRQLHHLESFSSDAGIHVMVINAQAFAAREADHRRIFEVLDGFQSRRPIDVISATRPILILDEPQRLEGSATLGSLEAFRALMVLRYSATHRSEHNKVHRLDALDAYHQKLVKKIAVRGIAVKGLGSAGYLYLQSIAVSRRKRPEACVEFEQRLSGGSIRRVVRQLCAGDDLFDLSRGLDAYRGFVVADIDASSGTLSFANGVELAAGEARGDVTEAALRRIQIREAIQAHFDKERALYQHGVKVLTLFFIDEVVRYRDYAAPGEKGEYARIFEEEYRLRHAEALRGADTPYVRYLRGLSAEATHGGYFSIDRKSRRLADPFVTARGDNAGLSDDAHAYELILKDKERLLSFAEPVRFLFSHSALREGWDNPNVFVICALKHSDNTVSRRQEVGRGLRLCVDQHGDRMDDPATVHDVNVLTVVAGESYRDFVAGLQRDFAESLSARPREAGEAYFTGKVLETPAGRVVDGVYSECQLPMIMDDRKAASHPPGSAAGQVASLQLWERIARKAASGVAIDSGELVRSAVRALNDKHAGVRVAPLRYTMQHGELAAAVRRDLVQGGAFEWKTAGTTAVGAATPAAVKYDLVGRLSEGTQLTRRTVVAILKRLDADVFAQFRTQPESFIAQAVRLINRQKDAVLAQQARDAADDGFAPETRRPQLPCPASDLIRHEAAAASRAPKGKAQPRAAGPGVSGGAGGN